MIPQNKVAAIEVTGLLYQSSKRFKRTFNNLAQASCINLWRGSIWLRLENGKRVLYSRTYN